MKKLRKPKSMSTFMGIRNLKYEVDWHINLPVDTLTEQGAKKLQAWLSSAVPWLEKRYAESEGYE